MKSKFINEGSKQLKKGTIVRYKISDKSWGIIGRNICRKNISEWYVTDKNGDLSLYNTIEQLEEYWYYCNLKIEICNDDIE